VKQMRKVGI